MRAIVQERYGELERIEVREVERPEPAPDEVLVRVRAASLHPDVWHVLTGLPSVLRLMGSGLTRPKNPIPGTDLAGIVESVGASVTRFRPGDEVFGETLRSIQWKNGGAFAEYAVAPEFGLAHKPANVSFEEAAVVPTAGLIALPALRLDGRVAPGHKVLVNGAAGGVGSFAVQIARILGAEVTGVDRADKLEHVLRLGATRVLDCDATNFTRESARYDLIFDIPGNYSFEECRRALSPGGRYVVIGHDHYGRDMRRWFGLIPRMFGLMARSFFTDQLSRPRFEEPEKSGQMREIAAWLAEGKLTPVVGRVYPLEEFQEALRVLQEGSVIGKILIAPTRGPADSRELDVGSVMGS